MSNSSSIEDVITQALVELDAECEQFGVRLLLIGGFAVRAYGERKRETTDVDFVTSRVDRNNLAAIFQKLGYRFEFDSRFGMKATRPVGNHFLQVDISVEEIHDQTTDSRYRFPVESFVEAKRFRIESLSGDFQAIVYVAPLTDLIISKLMTARDRDAIAVKKTILNWKRRKALIPGIFCAKRLKTIILTSIAMP